VYATGGNREAAWLSGIRVNRVLVKVYVLCGLSAGLAGVLVASRLNAGYPRAGELYELDAVAAVVVGGTSLFGGRGSIWGTLAGAFFIGILNNGLNLFNVSTYDQMIVKGVVLLVAASLDRREPGELRIGFLLHWCYLDLRCVARFSWSSRKARMKRVIWLLAIIAIVLAGA
jgi:ribose/xylose/arabinose/galactoside ABC-type transport system permease subunit